MSANLTVLEERLFAFTIHKCEWAPILEKSADCSLSSTLGVECCVMLLNVVSVNVSATSQQQCGRSSVVVMLVLLSQCSHVCANPPGITIQSSWDNNPIQSTWRLTSVHLTWRAYQVHPSPIIPIFPTKKHSLIQIFPTKKSQGQGIPSLNTFHPLFIQRFEMHTIACNVFFNSPAVAQLLMFLAIIWGSQSPTWDLAWTKQEHKIQIHPWIVFYYK